MDPLEPLLAQARDLAGPGPDSRLWPRLAWLERLERELPDTDASPVALALRGYRSEVVAAIDALHGELRAAIRQGNPVRLLALLDDYLATFGTAPAEAEGFDALDDLAAGLLRWPSPGSPRVALGPDMVAYQPTPARHVLDLVRRTRLGADDMLVDLGAGLGQVPLLAALCSPAQAQGIEIEPAWVACGRRAAAALGLARVHLRCEDLRAADLSAGTVFYLYTPLRGALLTDLLERLRGEAARRPLRIAAFGPCVEILATQAWLRAGDPARPHRVCVFTPA